MESINAEIDKLLDKGLPIKWALVTVGQNSTLKVVNPVTYKNHKGLKWKIAIIEEISFIKMKVSLKSITPDAELNIVEIVRVLLTMKEKKL